MPIVTLTTDLGKDTHRLAAVKMQLLSAFPQLQIVDISHQVSPHAVDEAVYLLQNCVDDFPGETLHIIGVDADLFKYKRLLAAQYGRGQFLFADNGFYTMYGLDGAADLYELPVDERDERSSFALKTVLVPAALKIISAGIETAGRKTTTYLEKKLENPLVEPNRLRGRIVYVNNHHNAVTNITRSMFDDERMGRYFEIELNRFDKITEVHDTYSQVEEGENLCFFNENGLLEIAVNRGKASQLLGLERGKRITIEFYTEPPKAAVRRKEGGLL